MGIFKTVADAFFPNTCIACGDIIDGGELCDYCFEMLKRVDFTKNCIRCGSLKGKCDCKKQVFYFNGMIAPFYRDGAAQRVMYKFKFGKSRRNAEFLAEQMAIMVKTTFCDIDFDAVAFVPMSFRKRLKRGFNQSEVLATRIAELLDLPILDRLLYCNGRRINQHDLTFRERFKNVEGLYGFRYKIGAKTILLVDDIKTTGATLNECSKQLILSGADKIYCVTGLMTERKRKNGN